MIPAHSPARLSFLLALVPTIAPATDDAALAMPSGQLSPVELTATAVAPVRPPDYGPVQINISTTDIPFAGPSQVASGARPEGRFTPGVFGGDSAPLPDYPVIQMATAAVMLDPFVVGGDHYRRAREAIDSLTISDGRFNLATGGRVARFSIGSFKLELGLWKHETVGPSLGPPIPVVNLLKLTW